MRKNRVFSLCVHPDGNHQCLMHGTWFCLSFLIANTQTSRAYCSVLEVCACLIEVPNKRVQLYCFHSPTSPLPDPLYFIFYFYLKRSVKNHLFGKICSLLSPDHLQVLLVFRDIKSYYSSLFKEASRACSGRAWGGLISVWLLAPQG